MERASRWALGRYLRGKVDSVSRKHPVDVLLEPRRLKLHLNSHKHEVLSQHNLAGDLTAKV
jgi:hypothetical protein